MNVKMITGLIEDKRQDFYLSYFFSDEKLNQSIISISNYVKDYQFNLIKKIESFIIPSIAKLIFQKKQLNEKNIYRNYFTSPYTDLLIDLNNNLLDSIKLDINNFVKITSNSIEKAICDLKSLKLIKDGNDIEEINIELGDLHSTTLMSLLVSLRNGYKMFLKPTPCEAANCFYAVCDGLNLKYIRKQSLFTTNNFIITDFLEYNKCVDSPSDFYKNSGSLMAVSTALNLTDIHLENLLAHSGLPVILDFESLFTFQNNIENITSSNLDKEDFSDVESTLFIEKFDEKRQQRNFISALQGGEVRNKSYLHPFVINDGTDDFTVKYRKLSNYKSHNRIYDSDGKVYRSENYLDVILESYSETFESLIENKTKIKALLSEDYIDSFRYRYIVRPTAFYHFLQVRSWQPVEFDNLDNYWKVVVEKLNNDMLLFFDENAKEKIIASEIRALKKGLIPFFYRDGKSTNLFDFENNEIKDVFQKSIYSCVQTKLNKIDKNYIDKNLKAIKKCLMSSKNINQNELNIGWIQ